MEREGNKKARTQQFRFYEVFGQTRYGQNVLSPRIRVATDLIFPYHKRPNFRRRKKLSQNAFIYLSKYREKKENVAYFTSICRRCFLIGKQRHLGQATRFSKYIRNGRGISITQFIKIKRMVCYKISAFKCASNFQFGIV